MGRPILIVDNELPPPWDWFLPILWVPELRVVLEVESGELLLNAGIIVDGEP